MALRPFIGSSLWQLFLPNATISFNSLGIRWPLLPDWWPSPLGDLNLWNDKESPPALPSCTTSSRQSKVWHMVPFHAWQESVREAHHCYCQIGPAVYSSITPSSLTVTGHHVLYINSGCDIDLFPPSFDAEMHPVSTCFHKERPFSYFLQDFYSRPRKLLQPLMFFFNPTVGCCWPCSRAAKGP